MEICINGKKTEVPHDALLTAVLAEQGLENAQGVAVAVNDTVIPKTQWEHHEVKENDNLLIIHATQGG